jgi:hypothetical protein
MELVMFWGYLEAHLRLLPMETVSSQKTVSVTLKERQDICGLKPLQLLATARTTKITFLTLSPSLCLS